MNRNKKFIYFNKLNITFIISLKQLAVITDTTNISRSEGKSYISSNLYQIVAEYSVTDLTPDKMTYLASEAVNYTFDMDNIYDLPGKTVPDANNVHEEFHVDEEALYDMIVEIFYEPVE